DAGAVGVGVGGRLLEEGLVVLAAGLFKGALVDLRGLVPEGELARTAATVGRDHPVEILGSGRETHGAPRTTPSVSTIRSPARPSHSSGTRAPSALLRRASSNAARMLARSTPASTLVPSLIVTGRSVFSRSVTHATPRAVVSSCSPPESVRTNRADARAWSISRYDSGSRPTSPLVGTPAPRRCTSAILSCRPNSAIFARVRG